MLNSIASKICLLATFGLAISASAVEKKKIDFVVGVDGDFKAAMSKAASSGASESNHFVIFFPDGEYNIGSLTGDSNQMTTFTASNTSLVGQSADKTVLYNKSINEGISVTATLKVSANSVYMQDITLYNKANYGNEANCGSACRHDALMKKCLAQIPPEQRNTADAQCSERERNRKRPLFPPESPEIVQGQCMLAHRRDAGRQKERQLDHRVVEHMKKQADILRPKFEAQIAQMGLQKNFIFTGLVPPTEVCRYIALMDILVHLSLREGLPRSVVQGMAAGKPVIAYPLDGTPEVISSGTTGYLIEPHDTENLVQNINILIRNAQRRYEVGQKAKERVADLFDWRRMADILEKEYIHGLRLKGVLPPEENHTVKIK